MQTRATFSKDKVTVKQARRILELGLISARSVAVRWAVLKGARNVLINCSTDQRSGCPPIGRISTTFEILVSCLEVWAVPQSDSPHGCCQKIHYRLQWACFIFYFVATVALTETVLWFRKNRPYCLHLTAICGSVVFAFIVELHKVMLPFSFRQLCWGCSHLVWLTLLEKRLGVPYVRSVGAVKSRPVSWPAQRERTSRLGHAGRPM